MNGEAIIRVRGFHTDSYGHVNNARYLEFIEEGRWAYFEQSGLLELLGDLQLVVVNINIRYRRSAKIGDTLTVHTQIGELESHKMILKQTIKLKGKTATEAEVTLLPVLNGRATDFPEAVFQKLNKIQDNIAA